MKPPKKLITALFKKLGYEIKKIDHNKQEKTFKQKTYHCQELPKKDAIEAQEKIFSISKTSVKTIFDVGANDGHITSRYRQIFPKATIYSFEPFSEPFRLLRQRSEKWGRVVPVNVAVAGKKGTRDLFLNKHHVTNSLLPTVQDVEKYVDMAVIENIDKIRVPVTTIDDFCAEHNIHDIQILKMDIQGSELEALKGARKKLSQQLVSLIYTEIWFVNVYRDQPLFHELYQFLDKYGYELYDFYNFVYSGEDKIKWADAIFINEKMVKEFTASGGQGGAF